MNSRAFLWFLVIVIVALIVGWFVLIRPSAPAPVQEENTATTTATVTPEPQPVPATPPPGLATVTADIVGNWASTDDANYTVQITAGGKWTDTYKGSDSSNASETGMYTLFTSQAPDKDFTGVLVPGIVYVKVVEGQSTLYFSVLTASANELQLSYLDRGNTLSFVKVQ